MPQINKLTFKTSDPTVATVSSDGTVAGVKAGSATVTVTTDDGGKTATATVTVA
ncbi:OB-fold nucleic acid binding domain-containing protein [Lacticaseibacillus paracasei subsp. paracasei Lpp14]|uniref:OB-fold nucleic acid binding domain-containing protein n=1 Tax=Lacticaseibacillus paracasei subsp. paracasei Lpp14 TaxID=1256204 RepID=A0A829GJK9_LACPA|nr:OB-fold nucleic acid binding domain-containing protein [Lacticaseibacillus paracasei subsp. paracasei Lpp14]